ncbi:MAG: hypothetical protein WBQ25_10030 [Nitrososphaeraceae archaeon]
MAKKYGVYRNQDGTTERALFVIDSDGIIRWSYVFPIGINPGAEGILKALESVVVPESKTWRTGHKRMRVENNTMSIEEIVKLTLPVNSGRDHIQGPSTAYYIIGIW